MYLYISYSVFAIHKTCCLVSLLNWNIEYGLSELFQVRSVCLEVFVKLVILHPSTQL